MNEDRLTTAERMKALSLKKGLDRIPVNAGASVYAAAISGMFARDYYLYPEKAMEAGLWALSLHKYDGSPAYNIPDGVGWDFGGEMVFPADPRISLPYLSKRAVNEPKDVEKLQIPDFDQAPACGRVLRFARMALEKGFGISMPAGSPMGIAGAIIGPEKLMRWFKKEPELVHRVLRLATDYLLKIADRYSAEFGLENCAAFSTYPMECHAMISPKIFEQFSLPYVRELHRNLLDRGLKKWRIHLCGDHTNNLPYWTGGEIPLAPRTVFHLGHEVDMEYFAKALGEDHIIGGNIHTTLLQVGTANEVYEASRQVIEKMKYNPGGFILMPACALPALTPPVNVHAMLQAARDFGRY